MGASDLREEESSGRTDVLGVSHRCLTRESLSLTRELIAVGKLWLYGFDQPRKSWFAQQSTQSVAGAQFLRRIVESNAWSFAFLHS